MELKIYNTKKTETGKISLPKQFSEEVRPDLVKRAVLAIQSHKRQAYGADPEAGKKSAAELSRRRKKYRGSYGFGISRVPRKILSRRGTRMGWVGAFAPGTVGGRRAHPPKADKVWDEKINDTERRKAIRSAMSATLDKDVVVSRGHAVPDNYPFVIDNDFESLKKTKEVKDALLALGFDKELVRAEIKKVRAGKGKSRGRRYNKRKSVLLVVSEGSSLYESARNISGVDVVSVNDLNAELLAPGTDLGRATLFTKNAVEVLEKTGLFLKKQKSVKPASEKKAKKETEKKSVEKASKSSAKKSSAPKKVAAKKPAKKEIKKDKK
ncbi:MAG: 50S ribosomal protein L4 [Candidatus Woesearchaeota archaeon]